MNEQGKGISRRTFLSRLVILSSLAVGYPAAALAQLRSGVDAAGKPKWLDQDPWKTIAEVQAHLFPGTEDAPGAADIQAAVYLRNAIEDPGADGEDKEFIFNGVGWLNDLTREKYQRPFTALNEQEREIVLREIEQSKAGRNWLSTLLTYLLEALLADPVYGGNPNGIGWRWLEHQPGFPLPPENKAWHRLGKPVHYRRKA